MRVIRTEMYFDPRDVEWDREEGMYGNPGLAFAWLKDTKTSDPSVLGFQMERDIQLLDDFEFIFDLGSNPDAALLAPFLSYSIQNLQSVEYLSAPSSNSRITQSVFESSIVLENSPPEAIGFRKILGGATSASLGFYMGVQLASGNPLLMILTVPTGIIIVGSAVGVSKALEAGIQKSVKRWFEGKNRKKKK